MGKDTLQMSSDSTGPLGGPPNLGLAPPRRFNKFQMGDLAAAFLIGSPPLHLYLGGCSPPSHPEHESGGASAGSTDYRLTDTPGGTCPRSLENSQRERKYQSFLMGVSLDCSNGLNWNILEQRLMDILCEFYGSVQAVKHNSVGENSLRLELSAKK